MSNQSYRTKFKISSFCFYLKILSVSALPIVESWLSLVLQDSPRLLRTIEADGPPGYANDSIAMLWKDKYHDYFKLAFKDEPPRIELHSLTMN
jgi:hypothetical protein